MNAAPLTVTELTARIKQVLEQGFSQIEVTGEISRLTTPSSGHLYFTVKDAHAAISAVVWRTTALRLKTRPKEGQAYVFIGHLSLYEPRGSYQLVISRIEAVGAGRLAAEFEQRKQMFAERGWFDAEHKLPVPQLPQHIGIVTSATAAAFEDVKKVLTTRPSWLNITLSPCLVQGEKAAETIVKALQRLQTLDHKPDVILIVRGGGSIEDLWCFNDERIIQAIYESNIPIISGVGHEIDTTLTDLVADMRAATPSNAAELACPARETLRQRLPKISSMMNSITRKLQHVRQQLKHLNQNQYQAFNRYQDNLNWSLERLNAKHQKNYRKHLQQYHNRLRALNIRLQQQEPNQLLRLDTQLFFALKQRLFASNTFITPKKKRNLSVKSHQLHLLQRQQLQSNKQHWQRLHQYLQAMNPNHVLQRGYAMTTDQHNNIISSTRNLKKGSLLHLHFHDGFAETEVLQTHHQG